MRRLVVMLLLAGCAAKGHGPTGGPGPTISPGTEAPDATVVDAEVKPSRHSGKTTVTPRAQQEVDGYRKAWAEADTALNDQVVALEGALKKMGPIPAERASDADAFPARVDALRKRYEGLRTRTGAVGSQLWLDESEAYPVLERDALRTQVDQLLVEAADLRAESDRLASQPWLSAAKRLSDIRSLTRWDTVVAAGTADALLESYPTQKADLKSNIEEYLAWKNYSAAVGTLSAGARTVELMLAALRPAEVDCWAMQEQAVDTDHYVIVLDEATQQLHYPRVGINSQMTRELYAGQEVLLCIAGEDLANRYVVTRGGASLGEGAVLDALSFASSASLHTGSGAVEIPPVDACGEKNDNPSNQQESDAERDRAACVSILSQARDLDQLVGQVADARDALAARLVGNSSHPMRRSLLEPLAVASEPLCVFYEDRADDGASLTVTRPNGSTATALFDIDGSRACVERLPASALLAKYAFASRDGTFVFNTEGSLPAAADGKTNAARSVRDQLQAALEKAVEEYDKALALVLNYRKHALRRNVLFNLGSFNENTLLAATLQRNVITFHYGDDGRTLVQQTSASSFAVSRTVRDSTHWGVQPGYVVSALPQRTYELEANDATGTTNALRLHQKDVFQSPALFVNFYACQQNLALPYYRRECVNLPKYDFLKILPSFTLGVPVSPDIVNANFFVGLGIPYIPYVTITGGAHIGLVNTAPQSALDIGTTATSLDDVTYKQFGVAPYVSINASAEILGLLFPQLKPAN